MRLNATGVWLLTALSLASMGAPCRRGSFKSIAIDAPLAGALFDDPAPTVQAAARVGKNFDLATVAVRLDGVDVLAALGLVPPFSAQSGVVVIGAASVSVSDFNFTGGPGTRLVDLQLSGLPQAPHLLEVEGTTNAAVLVTRSVSFDLIGPMTLEATVVSAMGLPNGAEDAGAEGTLVNATLGEAGATSSVLLSGGGELRAGFVPVAEAIIATTP